MDTTTGSGSTAQPRGGTFVVGVDGSKTSIAAADRAAQFARDAGARLHLVFALRPVLTPGVGLGGEAFMFVDPTEDNAKMLEMVNQIAARWPDLDTSTACVSGPPGPVLVSEAARLSATAIIVGNKRMKGLSRVLGSVANDVAHTASCDVLIVNTTS